MYYILMVFNLFIIYMKRLVNKGIWRIPFWQNIHFSVKFISRKHSIVDFGKHNIIERYGNIYVGENAKLRIGNHNYFNQGLMISCQESIMIGDNCLFGPNVMIYDNNHKFFKDKGVSFDLNKEKILIGNNCWIASNVIILKGTIIGNNCVIGANSVVSGEVPSNSIVTQNRKLNIKSMSDLL